MCILEIERTSECFDTSTKDNCVNNCCQSSEKFVYDILSNVLTLVRKILRKKFMSVE